MSNTHHLPNTAEQMALREQFRNEAFATLTESVTTNSIGFLSKSKKMCEENCPNSNKIENNQKCSDSENKEQIPNVAAEEKVFRLSIHKIAIVLAFCSYS